MSHEVSGLDWSTGRIVPAFQATQHLALYDLRKFPHDVQLTATIMAGIINRPQPQVYLITGDDDIFWLKTCGSSIPQHTPSVTNQNLIEALLTTYSHSFQGLIIYDPKLTDTVNIATMLAGQRDGIVVSPAQAQALQDAHNLRVLVDLQNFHWDTRLQAYSWAQQNLLVGATAHFVAGLDPTTITGLRSFLVATRTFIYWLDSRKYLSDFSVGLLSERSLMQQILSAFQPGTTHLGWFADESSGVCLTSRAAIAVLATDHFVNMEVWTAIQPQTPIVPPVLQTTEIPTIENKIYVSFTISDGDNLQYCLHRMAKIWRDSARGSFPIGWTISPVLMQAAPALAQYYMSTATPNDELIAGPSGAGYIFPSHWPDESVGLFLQRTGQLMQAMNLTTLEVLDTDFWQSSGLPLLSSIRHTGMIFMDKGRQQYFVQELASFGVRGILSGAGLRKISWKSVKGVPLYHNLGLAGSVSEAVKLIKHAANHHSQRPLFLNIYLLAWSITPSDLKQIIQQLDCGYEIVLPGTLLAMLARTAS